MSLISMEISKQCTHFFTDIPFSLTKFDMQARPVQFSFGFQAPFYNPEFLWESGYTLQRELYKLMHQLEVVTVVQSQSMGIRMGRIIEKVHIVYG